jgi:hypothetical protein
VAGEGQWTERLYGEKPRIGLEFILRDELIWDSCLWAWCYRGKTEDNLVGAGSSTSSSME